MRKRVLNAYRDWAPTYDNQVNPSIDLEEKLVVKLMGVKKGDGVLDAACGTGRYSKIFSLKGARVSSVDFSRSMLAVARKKVRGVEFKQADIAKRIPFADKTFDKIICSLAIGHIQRIEPALKEMKRVLKDKGFIVLTALHPDIDFLGFELTGFNFQLSKYKCEMFHKVSVYEKSFAKVGLKVARKMELKINDSIKHCFTERSFKVVKGRPLALVLKLRKV
ncbi:MAG TPA: methyltransferase domain-containing protein [Candidatus Nanoarchaeia archaeon]|nr:methyltransferase domain-containing protein [Candidatus Nanoarchaeia archaeon]